MFQHRKCFSAAGVALLLTLVMATAGCKTRPAPSTPEAAREELRRRGISVSEESFRNNAKDGHTDIVTLFLDAGINPDAADEKKRTALMYAAAEDHADTVKVLLRKGADVHAKDWNNETALAQAAWPCNPEAMKILLEAGADVNTRGDHGFTPLLSTALDGHYQCARVLLESGADINAQDESGDTGLMLLAKYTKDAKPDIKQRIFSSAAGIDRLQTARLLLDKGADMNIKNKAGKTALMIAEAQGNGQMVDLLKQAGAVE